jgi:hypothetical protein
VSTVDARGSDPAQELIIRVRPEGHSLGLNQEERVQWLNSGWQLEEATAHKSLVGDKRGEEKVAEQQGSERGLLGT